MLIRSMSYRLHFIYLCKLIEKTERNERKRVSLNWLNRWSMKTTVRGGAHNEIPIDPFHWPHYTFLPPKSTSATTNNKIDERTTTITTTTKSHERRNIMDICVLCFFAYYFIFVEFGSRVWLPSSWAVYIQMALW